MIIVSQDKKSIVTLDSMYIMKRPKGYVICTTRGIDAGTYKTEERVKEILKKIVDEACWRGDFYYMPEE